MAGDTGNGIVNNGFKVHIPIQIPLAQVDGAEGGQAIGVGIQILEQPAVVRRITTACFCLLIIRISTLFP